MLTVNNVDILNIDGAIRGMRNPMNSWDKSDSHEVIGILNSTNEDYYRVVGTLYIGDNDKDLMIRLAKAGTDHRKYLRQIFVSLDINAPLYWWKEFDTYKVGTTANSCSTMHKIHSKPFCRDDFSHDRLDEGGLVMLDNINSYLEAERQKFCANKEDRQSWHNMIQLLPSSYNQMRTVTLTFENLINIYQARRNHKLAEWHVLCDCIKEMPVMHFILSEALGFDLK